MPDESIMEMLIRASKIKGDDKMEALVKKFKVDYEDEIFRVYVLPKRAFMVVTDEDYLILKELKEGTIEYKEAKA